MIRGNRVFCCKDCGSIEKRAHRKDCFAIVHKVKPEYRIMRIPPQGRGR